MVTNGWKCENCGHIHEATDTLIELNFKWLDDHTTKTSCQNCGTYSIQQAYTYDDLGRPIAGYFLVVKTHNKIRKGLNNERSNHSRKPDNRK